MPLIALNRIRLTPTLTVEYGDPIPEPRGVDEITAQARLIANGSACTTEDWSAMHPTAEPADAPDPDANADVRLAMSAMLAEDPARENRDWWTADGRPDTRELTRRVSRPVKAALRDSLWDARSAPDA